LKISNQVRVLRNTGTHLLAVHALPWRRLQVECKLRFRLDWISTDLDRLETPFASILGRRSRIKKTHRESFLTGVNAYFGLNGNPVPLISH